MLHRCHAMTMPFWNQHLKAMAQGGVSMAWQMWISNGRPARDGMWATCPRSASSGYRAEIHKGYQKHTNPLNCRASSSDISSYHADFHEGHGTVREWHRHGMCELALCIPGTGIKITCKQCTIINSSLTGNTQNIFIKTNESSHQSFQTWRKHSAEMSHNFHCQHLCKSRQYRWDPTLLRQTIII
jgi:hypothetical protein